MPIKSAPELLTCNEIVWQIWEDVSTQANLSFGGVVGIHYSALEFVFNVRKEDVSGREYEIFQKLRIIESIFLEWARTESEAKKDK